MSAADERNMEGRGTTLPFGVILIVAFSVAEEAGETRGGAAAGGAVRRIHPERTVPDGR
jgi:hypothetical protein